jgi:hypothetical protein
MEGTLRTANESDMMAQDSPFQIER